MDRSANRRCVLLFAVSTAMEVRAKRLGRAGLLLGYARRRVVAAVAELSGVDLLVVGAAPAPGLPSLPQRGGSFGERLENAFADALARGYEEIVAVPGDVPQLGAALLARAFDLLARHRTVLGPSPDGGVYLLGCKPASSDLLAGIAWCRASVFAELRARDAHAAVLSPLADLDAPGDLAALLGGELPADLRRWILRLLPVAPLASGWATRRSRISSLLLAASRATRGPPPAGALAR